MQRSLACVLAVSLVGGCASPSTILDRSTLEVSPAARVSARNLVPDVEKFPTVADHLSLAQEIYQRQLYLLKERRNRIRSRRRNLGLLSFAVLAAGALIVSASTMSSERTTWIGLGSLGVGTAAQVGSLMQEDTSAIDAKVDQLELLYDTMLRRLRELGAQAAAPVCDPSTEDCPVVVAPATDLAAQMGQAIEDFVGAALAINVKG